MAGMTMTQKIIAAKAGLEKVTAGQLVMARVDMVLANDITGPVSIGEFERAGFQRVFDKDKIALVMDHFVPNKDIKSAEQCKIVRKFAQKHAITHFYDVGQMGVEHALLPEKGIVAPGELIVGADSHTCTYGALGAFSTGMGSTDITAAMATGETWLKVPEAIRFQLTGVLSPWVSGKDVILHIIGRISVEGARYQSMEFCGPGIACLSMDDRFTIANMAVEAGAKNGIFPVDEACRDYVNARVNRPYTSYAPDDDACYCQRHEIDLATIRPTVALPSLPDNTKTIDEIGRIPVDQVLIGSCTNGRIQDMRVAAALLKGRQVASGLRVIVIPATQEVFLQCVKEGLMEIFINAGAAVSTPTCGPCLGGHMGILAAGEKALSTTNRNFVGRMGHTKSEIYLASPAVAAATAVLGYIADPAAL